ncbi:hypothetical protein JW877_03185 [bacterium]|nr:hypothetical protein [bacterium]
MKRLICIIIMCLTVFTIAHSQETYPRLKTVAELGYLGVLSHKIQFSKDGTYFPYHEEGGQDVLFATSRFSLELDLDSKSTLIFLYQPLLIETREILEDDLIVNGLVFPMGTPVKFTYGFPFYRLSYLRELLAANDDWDLGVGFSLQIRNATISFESLDGELFRTERDVGPVPVLKIRVARYFSDKYWVALEGDGIYAPISYLNGSNEEITGAILDASLRMGITLTEPAKAFFNLRYLGGGAVGTSEDDQGPGDGYVKNWLHFLTATVGFSFEI